MPELSDVEGFRRYFARHAAGRTVVRVEVRDPVLLRNATPQALGRAVVGRRLGAPRRHGKWLFADAGSATLALHFGMTGSLHWTARGGALHRHDRLILHLAGGRLAYRDMRRFGGVWMARGEAELERVTGPLGPDAAALREAELRQLLGARRGALKPALMDQRLIAGLGNLLCDEILWRARLHPRKPAALRARELCRLHDALRTVLGEANRHGRIPPKPGWLTAVRDRRDAACPRCGTTLRREQVGGRTTCWCPRCQRADRAQVASTSAGR